MQVATMEIQKSSLPVVSMKTQTGRVPRNWMDERARNAKCSGFGRFRCQREPQPTPLCTPIYFGTVCHFSSEGLLRRES